MSLLGGERILVRPCIEWVPKGRGGVFLCVTGTLRQGSPGAAVLLSTDTLRIRNKRKEAIRENQGP